jgi:prepilin signal peptidase PulO-like enzyme (type II secretory pathway)
MFLENILTNLVIIAWGLIAGSFLGQLADRLPKNQKIWSFKERSRCPHCRKKIKSTDLIPVLSFILLRGRCRSCHKKISWHYPVTELLSALISVYWYGQLGLSWELLVQCVLWYSLLLIAVIDWRKQIVFTSTIWLSGILAMTVAVLQAEPAAHLWAALVSASIFYTVAYLGKLYYKQEALGQGDIYIAAVAGLYLGLPLALLSFYFALLLGGAAALYLIVFKKLKSKTKIAFGPALILGIILAQCFGDTMLRWWLG